MKKVLLLLLLCLVVAVVPALAEIEIRVAGDISVATYDKYLWRGQDLSGSTPVVQGGIDLTSHRLTVSGMGNMQLNDDPETGFRAGDLSRAEIGIDYAFDLGDVTTWHLGNIYYPTAVVEDTNELYLAAILNAPLQPRLTAYYDWDEYRDDRFYTVDLSHEFDFDRVKLKTTALASYADNDGAHEPWNAELGVAAAVALTKQLTLTPSFLYSSPLSNDAQAQIDTETSGGLTVALAF